MIRKIILSASLPGLLFAGSGCVERILTIQTNPSGALVQLNGQEFGTTPASHDFVWYGTYDVVIRKENFNTLKTTAKVIAPIYEWVPLDLIAELLPIPFKDHHNFAYTLTPAPAGGGAPPGIVGRAEQLRGEMQTPATRR